jgi:hypothetical protein
MKMLMKNLQSVVSNLILLSNLIDKDKFDDVTVFIEEEIEEGKTPIRHRTRRSRKRRRFCEN